MLPMRVMKLWFLGVSLCTSLSLGSDIPEAPAWPRSIEMAGWHAEAVAVAIAEFRKHQGSKMPEGLPIYGDLRHYSVELSRSSKDEIPVQYAHEQCVRVTFAPELGARDRREATVGGGTDYGIEVWYDILKHNLKIIKTSFAR
jgi:hypothetical protein